MNKGWATKRILGSNEFFIVGTADDPAKISEVKSAPDDFARIAHAKAKFFSRGDNSGTHKKRDGCLAEDGHYPFGLLVYCDEGLHDSDTQKG